MAKVKSPAPETVDAPVVDSVRIYNKSRKRYDTQLGSIQPGTFGNVTQAEADVFLNDPAYAGDFLSNEPAAATPDSTAELAKADLKVAQDKITELTGLLEQLKKQNAEPPK